MGNFCGKFDEKKVFLHLRRNCQPWYILHNNLENVVELHDVLSYIIIILSTIDSLCTNQNIIRPNLHQLNCHITINCNFYTSPSVMTDS